MAGLTEACTLKGQRTQERGSACGSLHANLNTIEWYHIDFNGPLCAWGQQAFPAVRQEADVGISPSHRGGFHGEAGGAAVPWAAGTHAGDCCHGDGARPAPCAWATSFLSGDGRARALEKPLLFPHSRGHLGVPMDTGQAQGKTRSSWCVRYSTGGVTDC